MANWSSEKGGCVIAMRGKDCLAIAADQRLGLDTQSASNESRQIFRMAPGLLMGLTGLQGDIVTIYNRILFRKSIFEIVDGRPISPKVLTTMLSKMLYENRFAPFFIEPVIAGLDPEPYICCLDLIGCPNIAKDFVVVGSCADQLLGMCESLWYPDMSPDQLFQTISQTITNSFNRDSFTGCGSSIFILEQDKITERLINTRMD